MSDLKPLPEDKYLFHQLNADGHLETIDERTGEVVRVQLSTTAHIQKEIDPENFVKYDWDGREVWLERGVNPAILEFRRKKYLFTPALGDIICQRLLEGDRITKICKDKNMPSYAMIARWRRQHDDFNTAFKMAIEDRAWYFEDKYVDEAESDYGKDEAHLQKARMEAYKSVAEKSNPGQFGNKTKVIGGGGATSIVIVTGVPQPDELASQPERDVTSEIVEGSDGDHKAEDGNGKSSASDNVGGYTGASLDD